MRIKLIVLLCIGILCSSSIKDEEGRYESKPPYRSFILENYTEESAKHYFDTAPIDSWEGIWLLTENGERVAIERFKDIRFPKSLHTESLNWIRRYAVKFPSELF